MKLTEKQSKIRKEVLAEIADVFKRGKSQPFFNGGSQLKKFSRLESLFRGYFSEEVKSEPQILMEALPILERIFNDRDYVKVFSDKMEDRYKNSNFADNFLQFIRKIIHG